MNQHIERSGAQQQGRVPPAIAATAPVQPAAQAAPNEGRAPVGAGSAPAASPPMPAPNKAAAGRQQVPLPESRWSLRQYKDGQHWVCLERGTPYDSVFEPQFWANVASKFRSSGETIRVINDERTVFAELIVLQYGPNWARVGEWHKKTLDELMQSSPNQGGNAEHYRVEDGGPIDRWRIIRLTDQAVVAKGLENEATGYAYLANMLKRAGR